MSYRSVTMKPHSSPPGLPLPSRRASLLAGLGTLLHPLEGLAQTGAIRFGLTPVFLDDRVRLLRQWSRYLETELGARVQFVQFGAYNQVVDALRAGQLDFAWICGYPYVLHQRELQLVAVPRWRGKPLYQSYLIVDAASTIHGVEELRGRNFAYSDPLSNSGFLYIQHLLRSRHHDPTRFFGRDFFTYSHRHVVEAVSQGLAEAGAVDGYVWETLAELMPDMTSRTRVLLRSPDFGFPPIVAPLGTPARRVARFAAALANMPHTADGQTVLGDLRLDGFGPAPAGLFSGIADMARGQRG